MTDQEILDTIALLLRSRNNNGSAATQQEPTMEAELKGYLNHEWNFGRMRDKRTCREFCSNPRNWAQRYSDMSEQQKKMVRGLRMFMDRWNGEQS